MRGKKDSKKNRKRIDGDMGVAKGGEKGFEDPFFLKIQPIINKMESDASFYKLVFTDFQKAVAPYNLEKTELSELKKKLKKVKRPAGLEDFDDPIIA